MNVTTIHGCNTIPSDPECTFPRTCTSSVDFTVPYANGRLIKNKTIVEYGYPILFTFFAINGAGNGDVAKYIYRNDTGKHGHYLYYNITDY